MVSRWLIISYRYRDVGFGEPMISIVNEEGGITTIKWETYNQIMRERYEDGLKETWNVAIGSINSLIDKTVDETELIGLQHAKLALREAISAHRSKSLG
jgi:hypothetical protein